MPQVWTVRVDPEVQRAVRVASSFQVGVSQGEWLRRAVLCYLEQLAEHQGEDGWDVFGRLASELCGEAEKHTDS